MEANFRIVLHLNVDGLRELVDSVRFLWNAICLSSFDRVSCGAEDRILRRMLGLLWVSSFGFRSLIVADFVLKLWTVLLGF